MTQNPFKVGRELLAKLPAREAAQPPARTVPPEELSAWAWARFLELGGYETPTTDLVRTANKRIWAQVEAELEGNPASKTLPAFQRPPIERPADVPKLCSRCGSNDHASACSTKLGCSTPVAPAPDDWICLCRQEPPKPDPSLGRRGRA